MDFSNYSVSELLELKTLIDAQIQAKQEKKTQYWTLDYNQYKGTGKAWIAEVDEQTKKIIAFLDPENNEKDGYKGTKHYNIPLIEGKVYKMVEAGSKSRNTEYYKKVVNGELVDL
jgi:hypothetical protein